jgi:hypothetical protein
MSFTEAMHLLELRVMLNCVKRQPAEQEIPNLRNDNASQGSSSSEWQLALRGKIARFARRWNGYLEY